MPVEPRPAGHPVWRSTDGEAWEEIWSDREFYLYNIVYDGEAFVLSSSRGGRLLRSVDGEAWTEVAPLEEGFLYNSRVGDELALWRGDAPVQLHLGRGWPYVWRSVGLGEAVGLMAPALIRGRLTAMANFGAPGGRDWAVVTGVDTAAPVRVDAPYTWAIFDLPAGVLFADGRLAEDPERLDRWQQHTGQVIDLDQRGQQLALLTGDHRGAGLQEAWFSEDGGRTILPILLPHE